MKKLVFKFGMLATVMLLLVQTTKYSLFTQNLTNEIWTGLFAILFLGFGVVIAMIYFKPKENNPISIELPPEHPSINHQKIKELKISKREYEVLQLIAEGLSNQEIAQKLFISESTVKTHVSNLLSKLDAKRRTQALTKAKEMKIV